MTEVLSALGLMHGLGLSLVEVIALAEKYGALLSTGISIIKQIVALAHAFKATFNHSPMEAVTNAADIKFGLRLPTPAEEEVMFKHASDVGQNGGA